MASLLLALLLWLGSPAVASCDQIDTAVLDSHTGWAMAAWRAGDGSRLGEVYQLLLEDLACLAGSGLRTRNTDLFIVLARGALDQGDDGRALAAFRALLVLEPGFQPDPLLMPLDQPIAPLFAMAQVLGPDAAGFKATFLGQSPPFESATPAAAAVPTPEQLEAMKREELLAKVRQQVEADRRAHHAGAVTAGLGGLTAGLSLAFIAARNTSGENKTAVEDRPQRELMGKVWTGTAIGGAVTMGFGLWLMRASQLDAGVASPAVGWGWRF